jgi:hypothetical protein
MGAGVSTPESFFAFQVVKLEYSLLSGSENISENDLQLHLEALFTTAKNEFAFLSPLECSEPSCILIKLKNFDPIGEAKKFCKVTVSECLAAREKSKPQVVESDYSKGFSGSAADTKAEKEFEKMYVLLFLCVITYSTVVMAVWQRSSIGVCLICYDMLCYHVMSC